MRRHEASGVSDPPVKVLVGTAYRAIARYSRRASSLIGSFVFGATEAKGT